MTSDQRRGLAALVGSVALILSGCVLVREFFAFGPGEPNPLLWLGDAGILLMGLGMYVALIGLLLRIE